MIENQPSFLEKKNYYKASICTAYGIGVRPQKKHILPFHKKVTNCEHPQPDSVRDQFIARLYTNPLEHSAKVMFWISKFFQEHNKEKKN